ncbi:MAG: hypothetical protein IKE60_33775 [Reyranella sp.]|uniref:hypothetical protein n=1 Tax=Reyranella sp. TaxID=1929291 RepID=UPI0025F13B47|nr:hypothetical protein [Reyranella sp.]MBR2819689.1 hypothetical protein [Reyranella sp.]
MAPPAPPSATRKHCPPASLAWQEYQVKLSPSRTITVCLSLADPHDKTIARVMTAHDALHMGLLVVLDDPESLEETILWFHQAAALTLVSQNGDILIGDEVRVLLPRYFAVFFDEIRDLAPELADVKLAVPRTGDKRLH